MVTPMVVCGGCVRHVRESDLRCPFCGEARRLAQSAVPDAPRGASRAVIAALGASLSLGAVQAPVEKPSEPVAIAPPYGIPPELIPQRPSPPQVRSLSWLITVSGRVSMAGRAGALLEISATNRTSTAIRPERHRLRMRVNGVPSPAFDLAFSNGIVGPGWDAIAPNAQARDGRRLLEGLMPAPGEYMLVLEWDGHPVARRSVTVTP